MFTSILHKKANQKKYGESVIQQIKNLAENNNTAALFFLPLVQDTLRQRIESKSLDKKFHSDELMDESRRLFSQSCESLRHHHRHANNLLPEYVKTVLILNAYTLILKHVQFLLAQINVADRDKLIVNQLILTFIQLHELKIIGSPAFEWISQMDDNKLMKLSIKVRNLLETKEEGMTLAVFMRHFDEKEQCNMNVPTLHC